MMGMENGMGEAASRGPVASVILASTTLSGPPSHRDHGSFWETGTGPRHASVYGCF